MRQTITSARLSLIATVLFPTSICFAQKKELTEDQMLRGEKTEIIQKLPQFLGWVDDSHFLINKRLHPDTSDKILLVDCKTGKETPSTSDLLKKPDSASLRAVSAKAGDLFLKESGRPEERLTRSADPEINPTLSPDNNFVAFTRKNNLYSINLNTKKEIQLTNDGSEVILNGYASWVYFEEILGRSFQYRTFWWSPDSKNIAFMRMDDSKVPVFPLYSSDGQHGQLESNRYPKSGDPNPEVKIGVVSPEGSRVIWAEFNERDDQYFGMPYWSPDGQALWVQWMNRGQDNLKIFEVNLLRGTKKEIYDEKQVTWIDLDDEGDRIMFTGKNKGFILKSDKDGWENLYWHNMDGTLKNQATKGEFWDTKIVKLDEAKQEIYFTARKENSTRADLYKVSFEGKNQHQLSFGDFTHRIDLSPNNSYFITTYSNSSAPEKMSLADANGKLIKELGDAKGSEFNNYKLAKTEIVRIKSEDGLYDLPARITWPLNFDPSKKYPVLISIYGGPNDSEVSDGWQFSGQGQWWAKEGLIQVTMDHRGSGHFGKKGVNYMHRNLGYWEMKDWITIVKWLREHGADSTRIGISGFSYGGYMSCYALTYGAGYFTHGLAGGSVTDWSLYDTHYTERYMDKPEENPEGYRNSSALTHADKYKGLLRIYHGTMDDNVHMQNSIQLVRKLQESKKHFEFMLYPGGRHGWKGNQSLHSTNENNMFIYKYLLNKEMPKAMLK